MRMKVFRSAAIVAVITLMAAGAEAAFMVETHASGLANGNYAGDGIISSDLYPSHSRAVGITAKNAVFGGTGDRTYVFSYMPVPSPINCPDLDNLVFDAGTDLGNGNLATGLAGGVPGLYNVYTTWRFSENVAKNNTKYTVTSEGGETVMDAVNQYGAAAGSDNWLKIGENVTLITGRTYTVTQEAIDKGPYVSTRASAVMWELVEPLVPIGDVVAAGGELNVEEGGEADEYTIALTQQPPTTIIVTAEVTEPNQIGLNGLPSLELTFTPEDWDVPQVINVVAEQDSVAEPEKVVWVVHKTRIADANFVEWDDAYAGLVTVYVRDYAVPGVKIREADGATAVSEQGGFDAYTMELLYPPTYNVTITIGTDGQTLVDVGAGGAETVQLVFTSANWSEPRTVIVLAVDDDVLEGDHNSLITHTVSSLDGGYDGLAVRDVIVHVEDNECGAWGYLLLDLNKDCLVNIADLAEFAAVWLECTQPYGENCLDLR